MASEWKFTAIAGRETLQQFLEHQDRNGGGGCIGCGLPWDDYCQPDLAVSKIVDGQALATGGLCVACTRDLAAAKLEAALTEDPALFRCIKPANMVAPMRVQ